MSGEQFLRAHGWKLGSGLWWHQRMGWDAGHEFSVAVQQQAMWLAQDLADIRKRVEDYGDDVPEKCIHLIKGILAMHG